MSNDGLNQYGHLIVICTECYSAAEYRRDNMNRIRLRCSNKNCCFHKEWVTERAWERRCCQGHCAALEFAKEAKSND